MSYLTCPSCQFTVSEAAARSPYQSCPRCMLRDHVTVTMVSLDEPPRRFGRQAADLERIAEAKARLRRPARGVGSA